MELQRCIGYRSLLAQKHDQLQYAVCSWTSNSELIHGTPLILVTENVHTTLYHASFEHMLLGVPELVLDACEPVVLNPSEIDMTDIYVVHNQWFIDKYVIFREGMAEIFRIGHQVNQQSNCQQQQQSQQKERKSGDKAISTYTALPPNFYALDDHSLRVRQFGSICGPVNFKRWQCGHIDCTAVAADLVSGPF